MAALEPQSQSPCLLINASGRKIETLLIEGNSYGIGRSRVNAIYYPEAPGLSRQHLVVESQGQSWAVRDLGSTFGTFVNGNRIFDSRVLENGDSIQAGSLTLEFRATSAPDHQTVVFVESPDPAGSGTVITTLPDALTGEKEIHGGNHMQALIRAGRELAGHMPLPRLFDLIVELSIETAGAMRGVLMTIEDGQLRARAAKGEGFHISSHVRDLVIHEKRSLLIRDAQLDEGFSEWVSIVQQQIRSILAVPLQTEHGAIGLIYLDSPFFVHEFTRDDLNLLTVMANMAAIRIENARLAELEEAERARTREMLRATEIQQSMLPYSFPPFPDRKEFELHASMVPAKEVGGDLYDFFLLDDEHLGFAIGDASGKGVPAALYMAVSGTLLRATALHGTSPGECLERMNAALSRQSNSSMYITLFYGILNTRTGEILYANGGHHPPYLLSSDGKVLPLEGRGGPLVGLFEGSTYETLTHRITPGEGILLFTDGVTEARANDGEFFEAVRLQRYLEEHGSTPVEQLVAGLHDAVRDFSSGFPQADDITAMALRYKGLS